MSGALDQHDAFVKALIRRLAPGLGDRVYSNVADWIDAGEVTLEQAVRSLAALYGTDPAYGADPAKIRAELEVRLAPKPLAEPE